MRFLRQSLTGLFLLSLTLGVLFYAAVMLRDAVQERMARDARPTQARERMFAVNVVRAEVGQEAPVLTAYGEVQSRRTLDLRAAVAGKVIELAENFVEGGQVEQGQFLLRIDPADAEAALARVASDLQDAEDEARDADRSLILARDELKAAEEQSDLRERAFMRQKDLRARGVGTDAQVETAELAASAARATVLARRQALAQAEARVDKAATRLTRGQIARDDAARTLAETELKAGFSGTLSGVSVVEGRLLSANERVAQLIDNLALEVAFRLSTRGYARLLDVDGKLTQAPIRVRLDVFGVALEATGQISRDSAAVGEGQTGRLVFARIDSARGLKPGDFVTVEIDEAPLNGVVRLPAGALGPDGTVLVLGPEDRLELIEVELLRRQGDDVIVRGHRLDGREVVAARSPLLGEGIKVKPLRVGPEGAEAPKEPELLELSDERRAKLVAFVEANTRMPEEMRDRILTALSQPKVPARMVQRLEERIGG
ncbi:efflux transporter periplasmic adaptor subunit [Alisedimentitalea sp. MJ-SS2]|uniref:efflux RND transporter periplasmic adaptor subunit n=1 Tax=Aliisedimentitalea sp. MJ-SS2 TaxID=3049795 RepID=UPI00290EEA59|nr:efflux transporter periplasmic adaptor subunit [Alisedimentitalea sp. MJ-SS2]MDU8928499.1 efflux transporter periplasmic adaptor subunit [Alisedimentitalea sp. MJ-SS2]